MIINASSYTSAIPVAPSDTINIPGPTARFTGKTTAVINTSGYLRDTNANFVTTFDADKDPIGNGSRQIVLGPVSGNRYSVNINCNNATSYAFRFE